MAVQKFQSSMPSTQVIVGGIGCFFGALMMFNALAASAQEKSAIHQIYSTLNWGLGVQIVLTGAYVVSKANKE